MFISKVIPKKPQSQTGTAAAKPTVAAKIAANLRKFLVIAHTNSEQTYPKTSMQQKHTNKFI